MTTPLFYSLLGLTADKLSILRVLYADGQGLGPWFSVLETDVLATELPILFCAF